MHLDAATAVRRAHADSNRADSGVGHCGRSKESNHPPALVWGQGDFLIISAESYVV
jgi:hypothetical protein